METATGSLGTVLKMIPPRSVLRDVPKGNRRRLCEMHAFFMENVELNGSGKRFGGLIASLTMEDPAAFGTLYAAASTVARMKIRINSLEPDRLASFIRNENAQPAFFLSVLKALDNQALPADASLVSSLASFHATIFESAHQSRRSFASGVSMAMLENPGCGVDWLTPGNALLLASLAGNLWNGKEFEPADSFSRLARKLSEETFSPALLQGMVNLASNPRTVDMALR